MDLELEEMLKQSNFSLESFNQQILQVEEIEKDMTKHSQTDVTSIGQKIKSYEELSCKVDILKCGMRQINLLQSIYFRNESHSSDMISNMNKLKECVHWY
jgi:hypothetical protein